MDGFTIQSLRQAKGLRSAEIVSATRGTPGLSKGQFSHLERDKNTVQRHQIDVLAPLLALGEPQGRERPRWVVTRLHASGTFSAPPLTKGGELGVFDSFVHADGVAEYLRRIAGNAGARAIPTFASYRRHFVPAEKERVFKASTREGTRTPEEVSAWLSAITRAFAHRGMPPASWAGYAG